ncbi:MAG: hypothetical protein WA839_09280 [Flavobacteriaceae bacterium]|tara:strand:- start:1160 stop:1684 length:525 start_codon:yes stop_codon:yes gene_type:complete
MKNNSPSNIYSPFVALLVLFFVSGNIFSQENNIYEIENQTVGKQPKLKNENINNRDVFYDLTFKMYSTYYFQNKELKYVYGKGIPVKLTFRDLESVESLYDDKQNYSEVQLITIDLLSPNDLNSSIDLTESNEQLQNLKYVFIRCDFNCTDQQINKFIKVNSDARVFFTTEKGS